MDKRFGVVRGGGVGAATHSTHLARQQAREIEENLARAAEGWPDDLATLVGAAAEGLGECVEDTGLKDAGAARVIGTYTSAAGLSRGMTTATLSRYLSNPAQLRHASLAVFLSAIYGTGHTLPAIARRMQTALDLKRATAEAGDEALAQARVIEHRAEVERAVDLLTQLDDRQLHDVIIYLQVMARENLRYQALQAEVSGRPPHHRLKAEGHHAAGASARDELLNWHQEQQREADPNNGHQGGAC